MKLRPYQLEAVDRLRSTFQGGKKRAILCVPTGGGKTVIASDIIRSARSKSKRVLFVAHRREIVTQTVKKLERIGLNPTIELAGTQVGDADLTVGSVQTLNHRDASGYDLLVFDECHLSRASSWLKVLEANANAYVLGLTATPCRLDGKGLGDIFSDIIEVASVKQLIEKGFLVMPRQFAPSTVDRKQLKTSKGDFTIKSVEQAMLQGKLVGDVVENWEKYGKGRKTVLFAASVLHSQELVGRFCAAGYKAEHIDGKTKKSERDDILERLASGETEIVSNVQVLSEGWDLPELSCCILARPTKSAALYLQMAGRALRSAPGKTDAVIIDHAGNTLEHGVVTQEREWVLEVSTSRKRSVNNGPGAKLCETCYACVPTELMTCPACGTEFEPDFRTHTLELGGVLVEYDVAKGEKLAEDILRKRRHEVRFWIAIEEQRREYGYSEGWSVLQFRHHFGYFPKREVKACRHPKAE